MKRDENKPSKPPLDLILPAAFSRKHGAAYIAHSLRHLDEKLADGSIPKLKAGRKTLVLRADCDRYLAALARKADQEFLASLDLSEVQKDVCQHVADVLEIPFEVVVRQLCIVRCRA